MSKELEAFNSICCNTNQSYPDFAKQKKIVETALIQAQKDKNELEELKNAINQGVMLSQWSQDGQLEKKLKALEIIKEKRVSVWWLGSCENIRDYNLSRNSGLPLTQEEFDLLKEVLL